MEWHCFGRRWLPLLLDPEAPVDKALSFIPGAGDGFAKWCGIAPGANGLLYCAPHNSDKVLVVDPWTRSLDFIAGAGDDTEKYEGIVACGDGRLFCAPCGAHSVLEIVPGGPAAGLGEK